MSDHGFHVHEPHDHEIEHAAQDAHKDPFAGTIAVMTAILATTGLQISIALAAMALLTRRKWLEWGMYGVASIGIVLGGLALAHI